MSLTLCPQRLITEPTPPPSLRSTLFPKPSTPTSLFDSLILTHPTPSPWANVAATSSPDAQSINHHHRLATLPEQIQNYRRPSFTEDFFLSLIIHEKKTQLPNTSITPLFFSYKGGANGPVSQTKHPQLSAINKERWRSLLLPLSYLLLIIILLLLCESFCKVIFFSVHL